MTDRFEVPEDAVRMAGMCSPRYRVCAAVDVPRLCRAEFEKLYDFVEHWFSADHKTQQRAMFAVRDFIRSRFPEAAPEPNKTAAGFGPTSWAANGWKEPEAPTPAERVYSGSASRQYRKSPNGWLETRVIGVDGPRGEWRAVEWNGGVLRSENLHAAARAIEESAPPSEAPANDCKKGCTEHASCVAAARTEAVCGRRYGKHLAWACILPSGHDGLCDVGPRPQPFSDAIPTTAARPIPAAMDICTACACERCADERAFLRLFIRDYLCQVDWPADLVRGADTIAAARKVAP